MLHSLQFIDAEGDKRFLPGGRVQGCSHILGEPNGELCLAEGFATGATLLEDAGRAVAVCFDAGNLPTAARLGRKIFWCALHRLRRRLVSVFPDLGSPLACRRVVLLHWRRDRDRHAGAAVTDYDDGYRDGFEAGFKLGLKDGRAQGRRLAKGLPVIAKPRGRPPKNGTRAMNLAHAIEDYLHRNR